MRPVAPLVAHLEVDEYEKTGTEPDDQTGRPTVEQTDDEYPLMLMTGRRLYHYHATMTRKVAGLNALMSEELAQINPRDAGTFNVVDGEIVRITSRQGGSPAKPAALRVKFLTRRKCRAARYS